MFSMCRWYDGWVTKKKIPDSTNDESGSSYLKSVFKKNHTCKYTYTHKLTEEKISFKTVTGNIFMNKVNKNTDVTSGVKSFILR